MRNYKDLDRQQIAAAYRELVARNERLKPLSDAGLAAASKFVNGPGLNDQDRAAMRLGTDATEQRTANTEAMIEMSNELAFRGEAALSHEETGE